MKKMILMAALFGVINSANAAMISWSAGMITSPASTPLIGGAVYLFDTADFSVAEITAAIKNGTFVSGGYASDAVFSSTTVATPVPGTIVGFTDVQMGTGPWDAGETKSLFMVVFSAGAYNFDPAVQFKITDEITHQLGSSSKTFDFATKISAATWTPVPEPATMALLGIGIVAVGLRRRRK